MMIAGMSEDASGLRLVLTLGDWEGSKLFQLYLPQVQSVALPSTDQMILDTLTPTLLDDFNIKYLDIFGCHTGNGWLY